MCHTQDGDASLVATEVASSAVESAAGGVVTIGELFPGGGGVNVKIFAKP